MWWLRRLFAGGGTPKHARAVVQGAPSGVMHAYFIRVGEAMASDIFRLLCREAQDKAVLVRLLSVGWAEGNDRVGKHARSEPFDANTYRDDMLLKPDPLADVAEAFWALKPTVSGQTPVVLIAAGEEYGREERSWVQTFNAQYRKAGGLPIVRLVICKTPESGAKLASCFDVAETEPQFETKFAAWCARCGSNPQLWQAP